MKRTLTPFNISAVIIFGYAVVQFFQHISAQWFGGFLIAGLLAAAAILVLTDHFLRKITRSTARVWIAELILAFLFALTLLLL